MRGPASFLISAALAVSACSPGRNTPHVEVEDARITLPAINGRMGAGYFSLDASSMPERLVSVTSPSIKRIELHSSGMRPLTDTSFPPKAKLFFRPGGNHAMLFGLDPGLRVGGRVPLRFTFEHAPAVTVQAEVLGPGGGAAYAD